MWPEGLAHYVEVQDVRLPDDFVEAAMRDSTPVEPASRAVALAAWTEWGRAQGACVDLSAPWVLVKGWEEKKRLLDEITRELPSGHVLEGEQLVPVARREDCDDVLFVIPRDMRLAVVHLTWSRGRETDPRWLHTMIVDGWSEWGSYRSSDARLGAVSGGRPHG